jgi:hypothetical protein
VDVNNASIRLVRDSGSRLAATLDLPREDAFLTVFVRIPILGSLVPILGIFNIDSGMIPALGAGIT